MYRRFCRAASSQIFEHSWRVHVLCCRLLEKSRQLLLGMSGGKPLTIFLQPTQLARREFTSPFLLLIVRRPRSPSLGIRSQPLRLPQSCAVQDKATYQAAALPQSSLRFGSPSLAIRHLFSPARLGTARVCCSAPATPGGHEFATTKVCNHSRRIGKPGQAKRSEKNMRAGWIRRSAARHLVQSRSS